MPSGSVTLGGSGRPGIWLTAIFVMTLRLWHFPAFQLEFDSLAVSTQGITNQEHSPLTIVRNFRISSIDFRFGDLKVKYRREVRAAGL
jgi:hypothetical protein